MPPTSPNVVVEVDQKVRERLLPRKPKKYHVVFHNDDHTTMDFVVYLLQKIFHKGSDEANRLMRLVHNKGKAIVGTYPKDVAETKVQRVREHAVMAQFPLRATIEKDDL